MGNYQFISEEQKQLVLTMSLQGVLIKNIVSTIGICKWTVCRVLSTWRATGKVVRHSLDDGRHRILSTLEISVSGKRYNLLEVF